MEAITPWKDPPFQNDTKQWYAIYTRARHEKLVTNTLSKKQFEVFLPLKTVRRPLSRWRNIIVEVPLFPGYVFSRFSYNACSAFEIRATSGVVDIIGFCGGATPIPEEQIESVRKVLTAGRNCKDVPYLRAGQQVLIVDGPLAGIRGRVQNRKSNRVLIVSIDLLCRAVAVEIGESDLRPV